jgi:hypothetical protein
MLNQISVRKKGNQKGMDASVLKLVSQYCVFTNKKH